MLLHVIRKNPWRRRGEGFCVNKGVRVLPVVVGNWQTIAIVYTVVIRSKFSTHTHTHNLRGQKVLDIIEHYWVWGKFCLLWETKNPVDNWLTRTLVTSGDLTTTIGGAQLVPIASQSSMQEKFISPFSCSFFLVFFVCFCLVLSIPGLSLSNCLQVCVCVCLMQMLLLLLVLPFSVEGHSTGNSILPTTTTVISCHHINGGWRSLRQIMQKNRILQPYTWAPQRVKVQTATKRHVINPFYTPGDTLPHRWWSKVTSQFSLELIYEPTPVPSLSLSPAPTPYWLQQGYVCTATHSLLNAYIHI